MVVRGMIVHLQMRRCTRILAYPRVRVEASVLQTLLPCRTVVVYAPWLRPSSRSVDDRRAVLQRAFRWSHRSGARPSGLHWQGLERTVRLRTREHEVDSRAQGAGHARQPAGAWSVGSCLILVCGAQGDRPKSTRQVLRPPGTRGRLNACGPPTSTSASSPSPSASSSLRTSGTALPPTPAGFIDT